MKKSWDSQRRDIEANGDKFVVLTCARCGGGPFTFQVSVRANPQDFLKYFRCPNCGNKNLKLYNGEED